ncbi:hypothetical protein GGR51DRAFT_382713 [Nemania sp. FL0031]|nr:hypothetical protein GGR51DRAFT_382713 [Nemania sp. FL0031]
MADGSMAIVASSSAAAISGAIAATAATSASARHRRMQIGVSRPNNINNTINPVSYMSHLRTPAPSRIPSNRGVGIHIHYQGRHGHPHSPSYGLSDPYGHIPSHSENEIYLSPQDPRTSRCDYYGGHPTSPCGCSQCYWRDFLTNDIEKYKTTRKQLRETYIWNLRELVRRHRASPTKSRAEKDAELEKLYWYYVGRVREIYDNHCQHHRLLFRDICLSWEMPEKVVMSEESLTPISRPWTPYSRHSSVSLRTPISSSSTSQMPLSRRESGYRWGADAGWMNKGKGKEKEVIPGTDGEAGTPVGSVDGDSKDKGKGKEKEEIRPSPATTSTETIIKSPPKPNKISMQQRFRQFWPPKVRGRSLDKTESAQQINAHGERHERDGRESVP